MGELQTNSQVDVVRWARDLTATIEIEKKEVERIKATNFKPKPQAPVRKELPKPQKIQPNYPGKAKSSYTFSAFLSEKMNQFKSKLIIGVIALVAFLIVVSLIGGSTGFGLVLGLLFTVVPIVIVVLLIVAFSEYSKVKKDKNLEIERSDEYQSQVKKAEEEAQQKQKQVNEAYKEEFRKVEEQYKNEMEKYNNVIVPQYNKELEEFNREKEEKLAILSEEIELNEEALDNLYTSTKLISSHYRSLVTLDWLYEDMSTSDHDIDKAIDYYDRQRQRDVTEQAGLRVRDSIRTMNQDLRAGFDALYNAVEDGNDIQEEQLSVLSKTRRDMNLGNIYGGVQARGTNKRLDKLMGKKK